MGNGVSFGVDGQQERCVGLGNGVSVVKAVQRCASLENGVSVEEDGQQVYSCVGLGNGVCIEDGQQV